MNQKILTLGLFLLFTTISFGATKVFNNLENAFKKPKEVIILNLSYQNLKQLPDSMDLFVNLEQINLSHNKLVTLPPTFFKLKKLQSLNLNSNPFIDQIQLFTKAKDLKKLQELSLNNCMLSFLPKQIENCSSLQTLNISQNNISQLPHQFGQLKNLENLDLSNNQLKDLPITFANQKKLRVLNLSDNEELNMITSFEAFTLMKLEHLILENVKTIPKELEMLKHVKKLELINCNLESSPLFEDTKFTSLKLINCINLDYNAIFRQLTSYKWLEELTIVDRDINSLPLKFLNKRKIKKLNLQLNSNTNWNTQCLMLSDFTKLTHLTLEDNQLKEYPKSLNKISSLKYLNLSNNPLIEEDGKAIDNTSLKHLILTNSNISSTAINEVKTDLPKCLITYYQSNDQEITRSFINRPLKDVEVNIQKTTVNSNVPQEITLNSGTRIKIPANSFKDKLGNTIVGNVTVAVKEFRNPIDIFVSGIPMTYNASEVKYDFSSAGMMDIQVYQDGEILQLQSDKKIGIDMVSVIDKEGYNLYDLPDSTGNWVKKESNVNKVDTEVGSISTTMNIVEGAANRKAPIKPLYTEKVFFKVKKYSKLKSFEISFLNYQTEIKSDDLCKEFTDISHLQRTRWLYEGNDVAKAYALLDSLDKVLMDCFKRSELKTKNKKRYVPRKFPITGPTAIADVYLKSNPNADNFLLTFIMLGDEITIPVSIITTTSKAKKIQKTYNSFYQKYMDDYKKRSNKWQAQQSEHDNYVKDYTGKEWTDQEVLRGTKYKKNYSLKPVRSVFIGSLGIINLDMEIPLNNRSNPRLPLIADYFEENGEELNPVSIYVLDYTFNTVYTFKNLRDAYYYPASTSAIIVKTENEAFGLLTSKEFTKTMISGEKRKLNFKLYNSKELTFSRLQVMGKNN